MRTQNLYRNIMAFIVMFLMTTTAWAQPIQFNPDQITLIGVSNADLNKAVSSQSKKMGKIVELQGVIGAEFVMIKNWEGKYVNYLKTARGYAEQLKAGTTIYLDGMRCFQSLLEVQKAVNANPQGIAASLSMTNLYSEVMAEFMVVFRVLKTTIAQGGDGNMLNGAERTDMLWTLADRMSSLRDKIHSLAIAIAYYNMHDVWKSVKDSVLIETDRSQIARDAMDRWKRAQEAAMIISR